MTIGQQLKYARNDRGLTIEDVAFHTRIPAARVRDMENDDLSRFANLTYARGFLKIYGAFLEVDISEYLGQFHTDEFANASGHEYVQTASATQNLPAAVITDAGRPKNYGGYVLLGLAACGVGAVLWLNRGNHGDETAASTVAAATAPAASSPSPRAVPPAETPAPTAPTANSAVAEAAAPPSEPAPAPEVAAADTAVTPQAPESAPGDSPPVKQPPPKAKIIEEPEQ